MIIKDNGAKFYEFIGKHIKNIKEISIDIENDSAFEYLCEKLPEWPDSVDTILVADQNSQVDKKIRAQSIIDLFINDLEDNKFLDFGCGEGHVVEQSREKTSISIGYDVFNNSWNNFPHAFLTTDWEEVISYGPYDIILLYDVIDHLDESIDVRSLLEKIKSCLSMKGKIHVRCHPWCSRHGTHMYNSFNKAFAHLVFTSEELAKLGYFGIPTRKVIHPLQTYESWFHQANLNVLAIDEIRRPVEPLFKLEPWRSRIMSHWKNSPQPELAQGLVFPRFSLEVEFINFILTK